MVTRGNRSGFSGRLQRVALLRSASARPTRNRPYYGNEYDKSSRRLRGCGTGDKLDNLRGNLGLASTVVDERQVLLELLGVVRGGGHGVHTSREFRSQRLLESAKDLRVHVQRHERIKNLVRVLLELHDTLELRNFRVVRFTLDGELAIFSRELEDFVVRRVNAHTVDVAHFTFLGERQQGLDGRFRRDKGDESGVDHLNLVDFFRGELGEDVIRDGLRVLRGRGLTHVEALHQVVLITAAVEVDTTLLTDGDELGVHTLSLEFLDALLSLADDEVVETTAQTAVTSAHDEERSLDRAHLGERHIDIFTSQLLVDGEQNLDQGLGERARADDGILRAAHLGGGDKLHRIGNLLRVTDRSDAVTHFLRGSVADLRRASVKVIIIVVSLPSSSRRSNQPAATSGPAKNTHMCKQYADRIQTLSVRIHPFHTPNDQHIPRGFTLVADARDARDARDASPSRARQTHHNHATRDERHRIRGVTTTTPSRSG